MEKSPSWETNGSQLVKKFPEFYETWRFITTFTRAHHLSLSSARSIQPMPSPHMCYMPRPSHSSWFDYPNKTGWEVQIIKLLITQSPSLSYNLIPLRPKFSPQHPFLKHPQSTFLPQYERPSFRPMQINGKIIYTLIIS
jgi:hypothetical protein